MENMDPSDKKDLDAFEEIVRSRFDFLFKRFGFEITHRAYERCSGPYMKGFLLASADCLIKIVVVDGGLEVRFGTKAAPTGIPHHFFDERSPGWFFDVQVISYVRQRRVSVSAGGYGLDNQAANHAEMIEPYCADAVDVFREEVFRREEKEFRQFLKDTFRY